MTNAGILKKLRLTYYFSDNFDENSLIKYTFLMRKVQVDQVLVGDDVSEVRTNPSTVTLV